MALTFSKYAMSHNIPILRKFNHKDASLFSIGKYICIKQILQDGESVLMFFDARLAQSELYSIINSSTFGESFRHNLASVLQTVSDHYDNELSTIELIKHEHTDKHIKNGKESERESILMAMNDFMVN